MLQEQSRFLQRLLFAADFLLVVIGWTVAYVIRFEVLTPPALVPFERYFNLLPWVLILASVVFWGSGLYVPDRAQRLSTLVFIVARAIALELLLVAATLSFYRALSFSRLHMILFGLITPLLMIGFRLLLLMIIRRRQRLGYNIKRVLIVGAGEAGKRLDEVFRLYPWMGFNVVGMLDDYKPDVLGKTDDLTDIMDEMEARGTPIDYVYLTLPLSAATRVEQLLNELSTRLAHVCLVPDLLQTRVLNSRVTHVDGLSVIHLLDEAPIESGRVVKRIIDVVFSALFLVLLAPLMALIAVAVKLNSRGPVLYRQERMSLNGRRFTILKFRTMPVGAEAATGPVWARRGDTRATALGRFLRRTSLDELPQFLNVLRGDMSIVGPRPERPVFIDNFRDQIPQYMLRHKVKAGITGWAQVNGWRGDTSIEERIQHDIYYIQHWSVGLDLKIMWMTLRKGLVHENAY